MLGRIIAYRRWRPPQPDAAQIASDFVSLDCIVAPVLDGHTVSPVGDNAIVPDRRVSRITKPESVIGKRSLVTLKNIALRECGLEGVVRRETAIVSSDKIVIAGVSIVGPNEETVATVSQTVAHDPIAMGKLLQ